MPGDGTTQETIDRAAIRRADVVWSVPRPGRHHDVIRHILQERPHTPWPVSGEQGFVTNSGRFVGRFEACDLAQAAGQIIEKHGPPDELFSEDVW